MPRSICIGGKRNISVLVSSTIYRRVYLYLFRANITILIARSRSWLEPAARARVTTVTIYHRYHQTSVLSSSKYSGGPCLQVHLQSFRHSFKFISAYAKPSTAVLVASQNDVLSQAHMQRTPNGKTGSQQFGLRAWVSH
jgi:hypothetical protein